MATITIPKEILERIRREARDNNMALEEYIVELLTRGLDPENKAREYILASEKLFSQAKEELGKGELRQAAEKLWGSCALAIKAYVLRRYRKRIASHGELWNYKDKVAHELGEWVFNAWAHGNNMHTCFYEGWCTVRDVEIAIRYIGRLVMEVKKIISS